MLSSFVTLLCEAAIKNWFKKGMEHDSKREVPEDHTK